MVRLGTLGWGARVGQLCVHLFIHLSILRGLSISMGKAFWSVVEQRGEQGVVPDFRGPPAKISRDRSCPKGHRTIMVCVQGGSLVQHPVREGTAVTKSHTQSVQDWGQGLASAHSRLMAFPKAVR